MTDAEDRKPQSDEARSAFTPPKGTSGASGASGASVTQVTQVIPVPPEPASSPAADGESSTTSEFALPEGLAVPRTGSESETTSEFALPEGLEAPEAPAAEPGGSAFSRPSTYSARQAPAAFTPPTGIPTVSLTKDVPWQDRMRTMLRMPVTERPAPEPVQKAEEGGPAVPRVLDLSLRIGELLLAGGEGAEDVEAAMFAVCRSYGLDRCEPTVTFTLLSVSYQPSLVDDPVTASRTVRRRGTDYTRLAAVFRLVDDLSDPETHVSLEEAYRRLAEIRRNRHPYPGWALTGAAGLLAGAASVLVGGDLLVFVAAALGAMLGDRLAWLCAGRGLPEFYQFTVAAMPPAAIGVALTVAHVDVKASAVITGGLFALLPGRALVAGVQDGLTGFYITASARLLEVMYFFVGIVTGVLLVLYFGVKLGAQLNPDAALGVNQRPVVQIVASMLLSLTFAVLLQQERSTVLLVTLNGGVAWVVYGAMRYVGDISPVASTAVAAGLVGLFGQLLSRYRFASALPYTTAAIGPLLPGSATYFGLLAIAQNNIDKGLVSLAKAVSLAMAIAIGVNLGSEISRLFLRLPGGAAAGRRAAKRTRGF
ncbi:threonine/serine exporter family protein [Streptomyces anandii]|uniref:threonine/serine ThrE exporter family protein n=1 Tax=Streptomyces anandii TaxID=285454 RepID=UPI003685CBCC